MIRRFVDLLDESALACNLLLGLSMAATIVFGLLSIVSGFAALFVSWRWLWLWVFLLGGLLAGVSGGLFSYIYTEHC
jgi:hypothetical protein